MEKGDHVFTGVYEGKKNLCFGVYSLFLHIHLIWLLVDFHLFALLYFCMIVSACFADIRAAFFMVRVIWWIWILKKKQVARP